MRAIVLALLVLIAPRVDAVQAQGVLRIKVVLVDADGNAIPMPRVVLLVSDNPATAEPRRIRTTVDGTVEVKLRPGNYTVESDRPIAFRGNAYQWTQTIDVVAGDTVLDLTAANAEVEPLSADAATPSPSTPMAADSAAILAKWLDSVVEVWTPTTHASGSLIDAKGLVVTNQRVIGNATSVEVQISPTLKVAGTVLAADPARDVAILWIDPQAVATVRPLPLGCAVAPKPVEYEQEIFTIAAPLFAPKGLTSATVSRIESQGNLADFRLQPGSSGGPVFSGDGALVGITAAENNEDQRRSTESRMIPITSVCDVVSSAEKKMAGSVPPRGTPLPVESARSLVTTSKEPTDRRPVSAGQFQMSSSDFDIVLLTPMLLRSGRYQASGFADFGNWTTYVSDVSSVLLVRVTPQFEESFWTTVGRAAAQTQGVPLPPIKRFTSNFSRMSAFCGDAEVTPIHPFTIERRVSDKSVIREGLYVFDQRAFGSQCATVRFVLYSEKEPKKGDTRTVDPKLLQQLAQDFM